MEKIPTLLNIIGLLLDMLGVYKVFQLKFQGLSQVSPMFFFPTIGKQVTDAMYEVMGLEQKINKTIEETNEKNRISDIKAKKWFRVIVIGFALQLAGNILQLI